MDNIDTIIFGGAGHKSPFYIGVIKALIELDIKKNIKTIYGSSGGAFFALILTLDMEISQMIDILLYLQPKGFHNITTESVLQFDETMGFDDGSKIIQILQQILKINNINPYITLKEYFDICGIELNFSVTNITLMKNEIFNYKNNPDMFLFSAIIASMSLPILIKPFKLNNYLYIDGSITNDLPFNLINDLNKVLAFKHINNISEDERIYEINNLPVYLSSILTSMLLNNVFMEKYLNNIIYINFDCLEFLMDEYSLDNVIEAINITYNQSLSKINEVCQYLIKKNRKKNKKNDETKESNETKETKESNEI